MEAFLVDLARRARPRAEAELAAFAADRLGIATLEPWDIAYASEKLRVERRVIDEAAITRHLPLPLPRVLDGLFGLIEELYEVRVREVDGVEHWHPDVRYLALYHAGSDESFAGTYCNLFARTGKMGGAWMDVCRPRLRDAGGASLPIALLNRTSARPSAANPPIFHIATW